MGRLIALKSFKGGDRTLFYVFFEISFWRVSERDWLWLFPIQLSAGGARGGTHIGEPFYAGPQADFLYFFQDKLE